MKMIDMKRPMPKKEMKKDMPSSAGPSYDPYPIKIRLEKDDLESLGVSPKDYNTNMSGDLTAGFDVIMVKDIQKKDKDPWDCPQVVELQITKLSLGQMTENKPTKHDAFHEAKGKGPGE